MEWMKQRVVVPVQQVLQQGITPEKLSLSVAVGLAAGLFPIPGTTTIVCLPIVALTRANLILAQVVNLVATPLELALIPWFAALGAFVVRGGSGDGVELSASALTAALQEDVWAALRTFQLALLYAVVGWLLFLPVCLLVGAFAFRPVFRVLVPRLRTHPD